MEMTTYAKPPFRGVGTALITPFREKQIDYTAMKSLIEFQVAGGADALILLGTTGEAATVTESERCRLVDFCADTLGGRLPLILGCGANDTATAVRLTRFAAYHGADGILAVTPYYNKGTADGIVAHYERIARAAAELPVILYNVPSRTGVNLSLSLLQRLAEIPNICGIKQAATDFDAMTDTVAALGERFCLYAGNDSLILPTLSLGGQGVISVASNLLPHRVGHLIRLWEQGKTGEARQEQLRLLPLIRLLFADVNPAPIKFAMSQIGISTGELRLPMTGIDLSLQQKIRAAMEEYLPTLPHFCK